MPSVESNICDNFNQELADFIIQLHNIDSRSEILSIIKSIENTGKSALDAGLPGIFELCTILSSSLNCHESITENIKTELINIFQLVSEYSFNPGSEEPKNIIIESLHKLSITKTLGDDQLSILRCMLDIVNESGTDHKNTELENDNILSDSNEGEENEYKREISVNNDLPEDLKELLHIIQSELIPIEKSIITAESDLSHGKTLEQVKRHLDDSVSTLNLVIEALDSFDFKGVAGVTSHLKNNITLPENKVNEKSFKSSLTDINSLFDKIFDYLHDPSNKKYSNEIITHLKGKKWFSAISDTDINDISRLLPLKIKTKDIEKGNDNKINITPEDVSLDLPDDIDSELLDAMLQELPDQIEELSACINKFHESGSLDDIQNAKRIAHTLKGASNTVGIRGIAMITHKLEDILLALYKNNSLPSGTVLDTMIKACDCLAGMGDYLLEIGDIPADSLEILQAIIDISDHIEKYGIDENIISKTSSELEKISSKTKPENNLTKKDEPGKSVKISMTILDQLLKLVGESITTNKQILSSLHDTITLLKNNKNYYEDLRFFGDKIDEVVSTKDIYSSGINNKPDELDVLEMDQFSDLHVYINQLIEKTVDAEESTQYFLDRLNNLDEKLIELSRINTAIKENVENSRLIQVNSQASRLQRIVRQAAKVAGKKVPLDLSGVDTLIDSDILNRLIDSLIHLIRNAVDHGIEDEDIRMLNGKNKKGTITLDFRADNNEIKISCEDDGKGLDDDTIRDKAIKLGIIDDSAKLSKEEIERLIFHPDFSTKSETTELSGRGIGLDAVYSSIIALSGNISVTSHPGKGTKFEIILPSNKMIVNVILVGLGSEIISLSSRGIDQIFYHDQVIFSNSDDNKMQNVVINGKEYQAITLESILQFDYERRTAIRKFPLIILFNKNKHEKVAILVDRILGCENMVLKSMGDYVPKIPGVMGISILGDGSITSVIDIGELVNSKAKYPVYRTHRRITEKKLPIALVVDDSLSVRRSLMEFMENIGYKTRAAHDGLEAFEIANACNPDIILTDMEMPRMNGLEFASHIKSSSDMKNIPVIMITSRSAEWHQKEATRAGIDAFITKPYSEEELLDAIKRLKYNMH